ncbi:MAG: F0F1 ATP synthase subunit A [Tannerella sp.]|jgi:F-type H+-transporting ATPase subunit a|nr:F0F1 ATP synthase subunit A [Tannerella sp.]
MSGILSRHILILLLILPVNVNVHAEDVNPREIIFDHIRDSYWWHITTVNDRHVSVYLPVIVYSQTSGWNMFSSSRLEHGHAYRGFHISGEGRHDGRIVETDAAGRETRPVDLSITKTTLALLLNSALMLAVFLSVARRYRRKPGHLAPGGFTGMLEMFVMSIEDDVIRKSIGKDYARYSSYLLTAFFFIFINNITGLIPVFPGGANVTGNISVTLVLAVCTMIAVNLFGNGEYRRDIFWPDVPLWMKVPLPLMPVIELFGVIAKPFALTIRLFANITAGHAVVIALTCLIFVTVKMGTATNVGMTVFSVCLSVFMSLLEILVAYIQAYVFTMLSAVFIGLSRQEHVHKKTNINHITNSKKQKL